MNIVFALLIMENVEIVRYTRQDIGDVTIEELLARAVEGRKIVVEKYKCKKGNKMNANFKNMF